MPSDATATVGTVTGFGVPGFAFLLVSPQTVAEQELLATEVIPAVRAEVSDRGLLPTTT